MGSANPPSSISATVVTVTASHQFLNAVEGTLSILVDNSVQICFVVATSVMSPAAVQPADCRGEKKTEI